MIWLTKLNWNNIFMLDNISQFQILWDISSGKVTLSQYLEILHQNHNISWLHISWDITPAPQYLIFADFVRYYTRTIISRYLTVADFVRYYTITTISHGCRFCEILHQNHNILVLYILWDITQEPQYPKVKDLVRCFTEPKNNMVADFVTYHTRTTISHG